MTTSTKYKTYPKYKPSGIDWLGDIPEGWEVKRLNYLLNNVVDKATSDDERELITALENIESWSGKFISPENQKPPEGDLKRFDFGDVLFGKLRPYLAKAMIAKQDGFCVGEALVFRTNKLLINKFLLYKILTSDFINYIDASTQGAKMPRAEWEFIKTLQIAYPSVEEQRKIIDFLDRETAKIDGVVAKKQKLIELLKEKRQALITHAVTKGLDLKAKMKPSGIDWLGDIPEGWEVKKLKHLTRCLDGRRIPLNAEQRGEMQGEYPYWGANGVLDYVDEYLFDGNYVLLGEDGAPFFEDIKQVSFYTSGKFWVNNHAHILKTTKIHPKLLVHILNIVDYKKFIDGSTRDKLTQSDMGSIPVQVPSDTEQKEIVAFLDRETAKIDGVMKKVGIQIEKLQEYRQALITNAVTGKIMVN